MKSNKVGTLLALITNMKTLILLVLLSLVGCGNESSVSTPTPTPVSSPSPSVVAEVAPSPSPNPCDTLFIGDWIDAINHSLKFVNDCSSAFDAEKFIWSLQSINQTQTIILLQGLIEVDRCTYTILSAGGLSDKVTITLSLNCQKSGVQNFSRKDK